jgi:hypothetical protein
MHAQRRLDLACLTEEGLSQLVLAVHHRIRQARDTGQDVADDLLDLRVDLLVEQALRRQEACSGRDVEQHVP